MPAWNEVALATGVSGVLPVANGGVGTALSAPGADRILFWDHSATAYAYLTAGTGLTISGTTMTQAGLSGLARVWVLWNLSNSPMDMQASYNMTSVSDGGAVGDTDHVWDTDFSSANYVIAGQAEDDHSVWHRLGTMAAGTITTQNRSANDAVVRDSTQSMLVAFGDQ